MGQSLTSLPTHIIFSTKHRNGWISPKWRPDLCSFIGGVARTRKCMLLSANGIDDHLHLLITLHPTVAIATIVREVKAASSRWIHESLAVHDFQWQSGYAAFNVSHSNIEAVRTYIALQEAHHKARSFQDELREFLNKHDVAFDERYIWE